MTIQGLIFDFDGLIADTEKPEYDAWQAIYQSYGVELALTDWARCIGASYAAFDPVTHLESLLGYSVPRQQLITTHRQNANRSLDHLEPLPGVVSLLQNAQQAGLRLAIASSSDRAWVHSRLKIMGLFEYFDCIRTADDVEQLKPSPHLYLAALECLGLTAEQAIAFEDSPNGITAAQRAGLFCVAVPNEITAQLPIQHANLIIPSLTQLSLSQLQSLPQTPARVS
ncbi:MAG: HAD-IA family hydrolase [Anaerolinea sp.]|nr:HAD-IA family hydrolase [Anaerolinea sp.]